MAYDADLDSTFNPSVGGTPTAAYLDLVNGNFATLGGAWTAFTPTWTASGGNPDIGNGTRSGAYMQAGKMLHVRYSLIMGGTTTYGTGFWELTLPNSLTVATTTVNQILPMVAHDTSATATYVGVATLGTNASGSSKMYLRTHGIQAVSSTSPFTWASGDWLVVEGVIEVA